MEPRKVKNEMKRSALGTPVVEAVEALQPYLLRIRWSDGVTRDVDVTAKLRAVRMLKPILDPAVFARARVPEWGGGVEWFDTEFGDDNLWSWTVEQAGGIGHERLWNWMDRHALTQERAAAAIGISRRMLNYYLSGAKPIPLTVWLACVGWESEHAKAA